MIDTDFVYARPDTAEEAVQAWQEFTGKGSMSAESVRYLGGGTEIVTGARKGPVPAAVIDIKRIPEARRLELAGGRIHIGAALPLNEAGDSRLFPLFTATVRGIADRTTRNRLSVGGNVAGTLPYREAVLPLLLADATVHTIRPGTPGLSPLRAERPLRPLFEKRLRLEPGELVLGFSFGAEAVSLPWKHYRATRSAPVDYPLVTTCFLDRREAAAGAGERAAGATEARAGNGGMAVAHDRIAVAISGLHPYPVFYESMAAFRAALADPSTGRTDQRATGAYRIALAADMIRRAEEELS